MTRKGSDVTETELSVMQILWNNGPRTIREVTAVLDEPNQDVYYATVKKLLERLEGKGFVRREPHGVAFRYQASIDRDTLVGQRLRALSDSLCDGSVTPLLTQLAQHERLTKKQRAALMALIDELDSATPVESQRNRGKRR